MLEMVYNEYGCIFWCDFFGFVVMLVDGGFDISVRMGVVIFDVVL